MIKAQVLSQLLVMQSVVISLPDESIFSFICRGLLDMPGVSGVRYTETSQEQVAATTVRIPLHVGDTYRGELLFTVTDPEAFAPYVDYLNNFGYMLAVILEERSQRRQNEVFQSQLEARVQKRTRQLQEQIAERQLIENSLRENQEKLAMAMYATKMGSWYFNLESSQFEANAAGMELHGFAPGETIASLEEGNRHIHPDDALEIQRRFEHAARTWGTYENEYRVILPDGSIRWIYSLGRVPEGSSYLIGMVQDITASKKAEEARLASELRFRGIFESNIIGIIFWNYSGEILDANDVFLAMVGYTRDDLQAGRLHWNKMTPPEFSYLDQRGLEEMAARGVCTPFEKEYIRKDGTRIPILIGAGSLGKSEKMGVAFVVDITERKKAEEALRESEERYRNFFDSTLDGIYQVNSDGIFTLMNRAGARIFGHDSPEEIIGRNAHEYWRDPKDRDNFKAELKIQKAISSYYIRAKDKNGEPIELESSSRIIDDEKGNFLGIEGILRDVTERKKVEEQLRQSHEEMQLLAKRLSDSDEEIRRKIATELHDRIGQNLTALNINLNYMKSRLSDEARKQIEGRLIDSMDLLERTIGQLRDITTELRPALLDEHGLISALRWHCNQFSERTGIGVLIEGSELMPRLTDVAETAIFRIAQEALNNVIKHSGADEVQISLRKSKGRVSITITDNGIGFDNKEVREKQSLGLVTMKEQARAINGKFSFISAPGKGTTVTLEVPG